VRPLYDGLRAARWRAVNYSRHESSACRHDIGSPRSRLTVHGSLYRSRFVDCAAGAVQYSYRNVDLLWDNVIAGPRGKMAPAYGASEVPTRREPLGGSGTLTICQPGEICDPAGADQLVTARPNPVRRDKSRPVAASGKLR
jgi:hypothetical protein